MVLHYLDRVRINTVFCLKDLLDIPRLRELKNTKRIDINHSYPAAKKRGYKTRIEITAPTGDILEQVEISLEEYACSAIRFISCRSAKLTNYYSISKIEIARDFITETKNQAILMANKLMTNTILKAQYKFMSYNRYNYPLKVRRKLNNQIFSPRTGYWGNANRFQYVVYARSSKVNGAPCCHTEFRIIGASTIRKKTGISSINDLKNFDCERFFEKMDSDVLRYAEIDLEALSRWIMGYDGRRTLTPKNAKYLTLSAQTFLNGYKINTKCKNFCLEDRCQSLDCEINSVAKFRELLRDGSIRNIKNQPLGNNKYRFIKSLPMTIYDFLKYKK